MGGGVTFLSTLAFWWCISFSSNPWGLFCSNSLVFSPVFSFGLLVDRYLYLAERFVFGSVLLPIISLFNWFVIGPFVGVLIGSFAGGLIDLLKKKKSPPLK